jgi:NDP-sugar pyrophosphorylase family protein
MYGVVDLAADDRIVGFVEKPADPPSTLAATATYIFHRAHVPLVQTYLDQGNPSDQPGRFVGWLQARDPVYGYRFDEAWLDIGNPQQLLEADNRLRARAGLPVRDEYVLEST